MPPDTCAAAPRADAPIVAPATKARNDGKAAAGAALLWMLVLALVAARAAWFEPEAGDGPAARVPHLAGAAPSS